jgi:hypothetical protein
LSGERVFNDCCDFCVRVDDSKNEVEICTDMTQRCKGAPVRPAHPASF